MLTVKFAIIDYGLGNLFSIRQALEFVGATSIITRSPKDILNADAIILPGVGAFGNAMESLGQLDLISPIKYAADSRKPLFGICLGMQLLMTESNEFGRHEGLNIVEGRVLRFEDQMQIETDIHKTVPKQVKIPHIGWSRIFQKADPNRNLVRKNIKCNRWSNTPLASLQNGDFMYFVHSYFVHPDNPDLVLSTSQYGSQKFCSAFQQNNIFAVQFHPERSGPQGLSIYRDLVQQILTNKIEQK